MNQSRDTPETVEELLERIQPLWDAVDVDNLPDNVVDALTIGAMSGRENDDATKRLLGNFELETPRDRAGSFEPTLVKKHHIRF